MGRSSRTKTRAERRSDFAFYLGVIGMVVCLIAWLAFDRASPVIFGGFGTLVATAQGGELVAMVKAGPSEEDDST